MKRTPLVLVLLSAAIASISSIAVHATSIDFNGIPNGTPVTANNPYSGLVNFTGKVSFQAFAGITDVDAGGIWGNGILVSDESLPSPPSFFRVDMTLTADFLQPVTALSFKTQTTLWWVNYSFEGLDADGQRFTGSGRTPGEDFGSINLEPGFPFGTVDVYATSLNAPPGGYFTGLKLGNWGPPGGDFWAGDFVLTVPEPSTFADQTLLLLLLAAAPFLGRQRPWRATASGSALTT